MVTSAFGKIFLDAYNEKYGTHYDAKTFFVEHCWPLLFNHNKYMMWVQNSPFVQMKKGQKVETLCDKDRKEKLDGFLSKVSHGARDASVALGYAASSEQEFATTSGQVTDLSVVTNESDAFLSWIGASLAIGVKGGLSILFNNKQILLDTFEGWKVYRSLLEDETLELKGNQLSSWNGLWIVHRYDELGYHEDSPMANFSPWAAKKGSSVMEVDLAGWADVVGSIASHYDAPKMLGYVYSFGQQNTTIGFIPFDLEQIRRPEHIYKQLFGETEFKLAKSLFGTAAGFRKSCQTGAIGVKALEPKGLADHIKKGTVPKGKDIEINFHTYITWILAMLKNNDLWGKAQTIASALKAFSESGGKGRTDRLNKVEKNVLTATNKRNFIESLTAVVEDADNCEAIVDAAKAVNSMPAVNVPYFLTLIRFNYATLKKQ